MENTVLVGPNHVNDIHRLRPIGKDATTTSVVKVDGINAWLEARSEILIVGNGKLWISKKLKGLCSKVFETGLEYDVPGGNWRDDDPYQAAMRYARNSAHMEVCLIKRCGSYVKLNDHTDLWAADHIPPEYAWTGTYTDIFVSEFSEVYNGKTDPKDEDQMILDGEWVDLFETMELLSPAHQKALNNYFAWRKEEMK